MFNQVSERRMHWIRWILTISWLLIIASLFYDPWSAALTDPGLTWSPFRVPIACIAVQGVCLPQQPYPIGTTLFWGAIVPSAIFILLVFGHELWRRICPLSFLSQIPRALNRQRQFKRENAKTGKVRYELAKVSPDSWLGRNYPYLQFAWLFVGLCGRILFFNADRLVLAGWLLFTVAAAIAVGYFYGGKSWCQYFCPMAPVQEIYGEPGGLFSSQAHTSDQTITQSMCRITLPDGKEQSACVACQNPCIDIDSERAYWDSLNQRRVTFLRYGYVGLVIGYFVYYYLYAGNWDYYFSGAWARQPDQLTSLLSPGFYFFGQPINVPKLFAVPLTLGTFTAIAYYLGRSIEGRVKAYHKHHSSKLTADVIRHRIFALCTFSIFNFFFIFGGRPLVYMLPIWVQYTFDLILVALSTLWVYKAWGRSPDLYSRENLANRFRKQLAKLQLNVSQYLEGRSLNDLHTNEVYVLAKVLPGFTKENRHQTYKGVVREALEEGYVNYSSSLAVLQQMRLELGITDDEHREVLEELGVEDPELLNPNRQRSLENQTRLSGYRKAVERLMLLQQQTGTVNFSSPTVDQLLQQNSSEILALRQQYGVTPTEEEWILSGFSSDAGEVRRAEFLLAQMPDLIASYRALNQPSLRQYHDILTLLLESLRHKKELIVRSILTTLTTLKDDAAALKIAHELADLSSIVVVEQLEHSTWRDRLHPEVFSILTHTGQQPIACSIELPNTEILEHLAALLHDPNPLIQSACLYMIAQLDPERGRMLAIDRHTESHPALLRETASLLLSLSPQSPLTALPTLEKVVYLFNSDFFHRMHSETLISLANSSEVRTYAANAIVTEAGDTCRELLLLVEGGADIRYYSADTDDEIVRVEHLHPGQTLDELDVLAHSQSRNTIVATSDGTRILATPVDTFDDLLDHDHDFARRVLELESRQLQRFMRSI